MALKLPQLLPRLDFSSRRAVLFGQGLLRPFASPGTGLGRLLHFRLRFEGFPVLYLTFRKIVGTLHRDPSRYRRLFTREGLEKAPTFLRRQLKAARKEAQRERGKQSFESAGWSHAGEMSSRRYGSYDDYVAHQRSKLTDLLARGEASSIGGPGRVEKFRARFAQAPELGTPCAILCLGARLAACRT